MLSKDMLLGSVKLPAGLVDGARTHQSDNWHTVLSPSGSAMGKLRVSMDVSVWRHRESDKHRHWWKKARPAHWGIRVLPIGGKVKKTSWR
jgi:hypothetical protein